VLGIFEGVAISIGIIFAVAKLRLGGVLRERERERGKLGLHEGGRGGRGIRTIWSSFNSLHLGPSSSSKTGGQDPRG